MTLYLTTHLQVAMSPSSFSKTPLLKVSRNVSACARCQGAKTRCDGKLPACTACERAGKDRDCSNANDHFAKGKERSYVASLESRIERLQKQIAQHSRHQAPPAAESSLSSGSSPVNVGPQKEASDVDDLVSDFGLM